MDVTNMHTNTRNASLKAGHYIKHCEWGDWGHAEEYQALSTVRFSDRDELWLTTKDRAQKPGMPSKMLASAHPEPTH